MRYLILGTTDVSGAPALPGARLRALLAALALRPGRPVTADALIDAVWDGDPPADAAGALQALVSRLRRAIGRDAIGSGPAGYVLRAGAHDVDLHVFERLVREAGEALDAGDAQDAAGTLDEALALWRGPALADLPDRTAAAGPEAARLTALRRRADAYLALGRADEALAQAQESVARHPLNEPFRALLIRALSAVGRPADALAAYEQAREVLAERLGADPGPELRALYAQLLREGSVTAVAAPKPPPARGNLRARLTSFVGREEDLRVIRADVARHRLVTLVGAGGAGKTRLSEQAGTAMAGDYPDGVWVAELASVDQPSGVPRAVLNAVGRSDTTVFAATASSADPMDRLLEHCAHRRMLLLLDNCEHVVEAAAAAAEAVLANCPGVTVLATSREPLGVPGEAVRAVGPLSPPTAHRLFAERAAAARPEFDPDRDPEAVAEICRRLDGLPLAIELAAARLRLLTARQIADRLDDRFRLLTSGSRTVLPRQQTLRAVVDWSWGLLSGPERTVLRRMSVFSGGCTLTAAEAVCADDREIGRPEVLDLLGSLVDKSLVVADQSSRHDGVRYRFLETIEEYVAERAADHPQERCETAARHTAHYGDLARTAAPLLHTRGQLRWLAQLEAELDNLRAVLHRVVEDRDENAALALVTTLGWFWWLRNYRDECAMWARRVAALAELPQDEGDPMFWPRMDLRLLLFFVSSDQWALAEDEDSETRALARRVSAAYRGSGPHSARFPGLLWPLVGVYSEGLAGIRALTDDLVANCRRHGGEWELACTLMFRTHMAIDSPGGLDAAEGDWEELSTLSERIGDRWLLAQVHVARGELAVARGRYPQARADFEASLRLCEELGARGEVPFLVARMAELSCRQGDDATAVKLLMRAAEEADDYGIWDARTYIRFLQGMIALRAGDTGYARRLCDLTKSEAEAGNLPSMFTVMLGWLEAGVAAAEGEPGTALAVAVEAFHAAQRAQYPEVMIAALVEQVATVMLDLAEPATAAMLLGLGDTLRGELPRSVPEVRDVEQVQGAVRAALGPAGYRDAHADGLRLTLPGTADLLDRVLGRVQGVGGPDTAGEGVSGS